LERSAITGGCSPTDVHRLIVVAGLAMAALFAYVSGSSFVFQEQYGLSQQWFGSRFGAGAIGLIAATQLNVRLLRRWSPVQVLVAALGFGAVAGLVLVLFAATGTGGLAGVLVPLWLVIAAAGLAMPNAPALALSRHGDTAGTAAALLGAVQFGVGALAAPLVGLLGVGAVAMAVVVAGGMVAANVVLAVVVRPWHLPVPADSAVPHPLTDRSRPARPAIQARTVDKPLADLGVMVGTKPTEAA
jgi:DHA1 family bicyclomycin/chloramphenicol resistance-like MFS transporter